MIRVLIADDHPVVRKGVKQILKETRDIVVADEAFDGQEALSKAFKNDYDVVLLDISLPGRSGLEILKQLKVVKPKLPILILSVHPEEQYAVRTIKAGASGYLTKESAPDELITAIRIVARGRKYIRPSLAEKMAFELEANREKPLHKGLSDREFEVMLMLASGKSVTGIAEELALSVKTISTYRARILEKFNFTNNSEITRYAIEHKLVS
ncbi:MAG: response regulator transcription factor [Elusimicrobia bacterium]|nr:response regulator transcription factor [Elusimicrobiota bacterium]